jgi:hypothetical protein
MEGLSQVEGLAEAMLADAHELVLNGWCQGTAARNEFGEPVEPASAGARSWSAPGALNRVWERSPDRFGPALEAFEIANLALTAVVGEVPQRWNDAADRTQWQVLDALALAAQEVSPAPGLMAASANAG